MGNRDVHLVPLLGSGRHYHPRKGACLLELVGAVPGGRWTDHPEMVDPVLSSLARAVNDRTRPAERPALAPLIPWLAWMPRSARPARVAALLAGTAAAAARGTAEPAVAEQLSVYLAATRDEREPSGPLGWRARRNRHLAAIRAVRLAIASVALGGGDEALRLLIVEAVNQVRLLHGLPTAPPLTRAAADCRVAVPVLSELRIPGGDSTYLHCTAVLDEWPDWLRDPWRDRSATAPLPRLAESAGRPTGESDPTGPKPAGSRRPGSSS